MYMTWWSMSHMNFVTIGKNDFTVVDLLLSWEYLLEPYSQAA